ncbi:MAG: YibE/F family protein [Candidatus Levyibacteriota bacterium]
MRKIVTILFVAFVLLFGTQRAFAQTAAKETYLKGTVENIISQGTNQTGGVTTAFQKLAVKLQNGNNVTITDEGDPQTLQRYNINETVIIDESTSPDGKTTFVISDRYRLTNLFLLFVAFFLITLAIAGRKGAGAVLGILISLSVIIFYIVPQIVFSHQNPLTTSIIGSLVILFVTTFLAHGFSKQTVVAVAATFCTLFAAVFFASVFTDSAKLFGLGSDDIALLQLTPGLSIDPKGILLGGIIIGTLGALNDVTTTQVATVFGLSSVDKTQHIFTLVKRSLTIGKEHIVSLVNTLVLAYAGTSIPIFIFLVINPQHIPYWVIINSESFADEIVRTLAGSLSLMLAVPIATVLAAVVIEYMKNSTDRGGSKNQKIPQPLPTKH